MAKLKATGTAGPVLIFVRTRQLEKALVPRLHNRFKVEVATDVESAFGRLAQDDIKCLLFASDVAGIKSADVIRRMGQSYPNVGVIQLCPSVTAAALSQVACAEGADGGVSEDATDSLLQALVAEAMEARANPGARRVNPESLGEPWQIIGRGSAMRSMLHQIDLVALKNIVVLLLGEQGVGKTVIARHIHHVYSPGEPFVSVNCGMLGDKNTSWSELFGHVKGSFTGATENRLGAFSTAGKGVVFLDEVGELDMPLQTQLLDALTEGSVRQLGGNQRIPVQCRVIAATNANVHDPGRFRTDLLSRFEGPGLFEVPPIQKRRSDIPELVSRHLALKCAKWGLDRMVLSSDALDALLVADFPNHVRSIEKLAEKLVTFVGPQRRVIGAQDIEEHSESSLRPGDIRPIAEEIAKFKRLKYLQAVVAFRKQGLGKAAEALGMDPSHLRREMQELGIWQVTTGAEGPGAEASEPPPSGISVLPASPKR